MGSRELRDEDFYLPDTLWLPVTDEELAAVTDATLWADIDKIWCGWRPTLEDIAKMRKLDVDDVNFMGDDPRPVVIGHEIDERGAEGRRVIEHIAAEMRWSGHDWIRTVEGGFYRT